MKYNQFKVCTDDNNILSHLILNCVTPKMLKEMTKNAEGKTPEEIKKRTIDIQVKINGHSVDPKKFFDLFVEQYDGQLRRMATKMIQEQVSDKFLEISNKLSEYEEITKDWAEMINWEVKENPFTKEIQKL